jgi:hypothetical protein
VPQFTVCRRVRKRANVPADPVAGGALRARRLRPPKTTSLRTPLQEHSSLRRFATTRVSWYNCAASGTAPVCHRARDRRASLGDVAQWQSRGLISPWFPVQIWASPLQMILVGPGQSLQRTGSRRRSGSLCVVFDCLRPSALTAPPTLRQVAIYCSTSMSTVPCLSADLRFSSAPTT